MMVRRKRKTNYKVVVIVNDCTREAGGSKNYTAVLQASLPYSTENRK
jgi:hypothetical protein